MTVKAYKAANSNEFEKSPPLFKSDRTLSSSVEDATVTMLGRRDARRARPVVETAYGGSSSAADQPAIEAPPSTGLVHCYLIDGDDERRTMVHRAISGRSDMIVRGYDSQASFLAAAATLDEGCVILFDDSVGTQLTQFIRNLRAEERFACILLATGSNLRSAIEAMKAGAVDCLRYPCDPSEILSAVDEALELVRRAVEENAEQTEAQRQIDRLTARETDVLHGLLHGKSNKMIALDLRISPRTVEIYRAHLMEKLGTHSLSETLKIAFAAGLH